MRLLTPASRLAALALALSAIALLALPAAARAADRPDSSGAAPGAPAASAGCLPLVFDPSDLGFGASAVFQRIPTAADLEDLAFLETGVRHVVLVLPEWPADWDRIAPLGQASLPRDADLVVVLPGYPPTRAASAAWNMLRQPLRLVMVVDGPPADRSMILELNRLRGLERVIADMPRPSRSGFERLQRPLAFRVVVP